VLQVVRWVSLDGSTVDVEISASGRVIDQPGLEALVARMATGVRRQPPAREPRD
jgi:ribosomal protein L28